MSTHRTLAKLIWVPRVLAILFSLFLSLFALDAFSEGAPVASQMTGFLIHLAPSLVMLVALALFWKQPVYSGWAFIAISGIFTYYFHTYRDPLGAFLIVSLPPLLIGGIFLLVGASANSKDQV